MFKFLGLLVLLAAAFSLGYYTGQHPVGELNKSLRGLAQPLQEQSRKFLDSTFGLQSDLTVRQGLVDGKARIVQAKSEMLDRNYGNAVNELAKAAERLEAARDAESGEERKLKIRLLVAKVRETQARLASGKATSTKTLNAMQKELDALLKRIE
ncbi:MAG: hypothetical protein ACE5NA_05005 [Nitrospiraceae bacterium]